MRRNQIGRMLVPVEIVIMGGRRFITLFSLPSAVLLTIASEVKLPLVGRNGVTECSQAWEGRRCGARLGPERVLCCQVTSRSLKTRVFACVHTHAYVHFDSVRAKEKTCVALAGNSMPGEVRALSFKFCSPCSQDFHHPDLLQICSLAGLFQIKIEKVPLLYTK